MTIMASRYTKEWVLRSNALGGLVKQWQDELNACTLRFDQFKFEDQ